MSRCVLDASAILAVLFHEPGCDVLTDEVLADSVVSTVNLAEVQASMVRRGVNPAEAWKRAVILPNEVVPFTANLARVAGTLIAQSRAAGLSLGGRACLALALHLKAPAYTADRNWKRVNLGVQINAIR